MYVEAYDTCQECGSALERTTMYRRHAVCATCESTVTV